MQMRSFEYMNVDHRMTEIQGLRDLLLATQAQYIRDTHAMSNAIAELRADRARVIQQLEVLQSELNLDQSFIDTLLDESVYNELGKLELLSGGKDERRS
jgi:hypothetical protein